MPTSTQSLQEKIAAFPRWHYDFDLGGIHTPIADPSRRNRHIQRERYFLQPILGLFGGSLEGKRVLDLGCNAGYWSLLCAKAGASYVLGVDGRQMHVDQAELVFSASGIARDRYEFRAANIFELGQLDQSFDVVLNLGLMYHVSRHVELMELIDRHAADVVVTDTTTWYGPGSFLRVNRERIDDPRNAVESELVLVPSKQAVIDLFAAFGFRTVMLKPRFTSWEGAYDFKEGSRRAFVSSRGRDLSALDAEAVSRRQETVELARHEVLERIRGARHARLPLRW